jgi:hypothetical protein
MSVRVLSVIAAIVFGTVALAMVPGALPALQVLAPAARWWIAYVMAILLYAAGVGLFVARAQGRYPPSAADIAFEEKCRRELAERDARKISVEVRSKQ